MTLYFLEKYSRAPSLEWLSWLFSNLFYYICLKIKDVCVYGS